MADDLEIGIRLNYSGRGMFGKTCLAFTTRVGEEAETAAKIIMWLCNEGEMDLADVLTNRIETDQMSRGSIIYFYFVRTEQNK